MRRGRPKQFDVDSAIDQALRVFWRMGYEGTTLDDLTNAMGISRPSLYSSFGNKEALFLKVVDRYTTTSASYLDAALEEPTARLVFAALMDGAIKLQTDPAGPGGCLLVQGALAVSEGSMDMCRELARHRQSAETAIFRRFQTAIDDGDLAPDANPADLASFTATMLQGLAVKAAGGATSHELFSVAALAMKLFPQRG